jgi:hypothetical protein
MPITPLHYPYAWLISRLDKRLPLPALIIGAVVPDIEVPFLEIFFDGILPDHYILHSLIGSLSIGLLITLVTLRYIYPYIMSNIFGIDKTEMVERCQLTRYAVIAACIGILSHLIVDYPMHAYNQILWPFIDAWLLIGPLVAVFAVGHTISYGFYVASSITHLLSIVLWISIAYYIRDDLWSRMWIGDKIIEDTQEGSGASH